MAQIQSVTLSPDCKKLTAVVDGAAGTVEFTYYNYITTTTYDETISVVDGVAVWNLISNDLPTSETMNGVITITEGTSGTTLPVIGGCEINCCIASLVQSAIDCHCQCGKCDEDLKTAEKVNLLLKSAQYTAFSNANISDAILKYNKAKSLCTATCACGC